MKIEYVIFCLRFSFYDIVAFFLHTADNTQITVHPAVKLNSYLFPKHHSNPALKILNPDILLHHRSYKGVKVSWGSMWLTSLTILCPSCWGTSWDENISGERAPQSSVSNLLQDQMVLMTYYFFLMSDLNIQWHFGVKDMGNECLSALDEPHWTSNSRFAAGAEPKAASNSDQVEGTSSEVAGAFPTQKHVPLGQRQSCNNKNKVISLRFCRAGRMQSQCQQDFPFIELPSPITALKDRCPDLAMWKGQVRVLKADLQILPHVLPHAHFYMDSSAFLWQHFKEGGHTDKCLCGIAEHSGVGLPQSQPCILVMEAEIPALKHRLGKTQTSWLFVLCLREQRYASEASLLVPIQK